MADNNKDDKKYLYYGISFGLLGGTIVSSTLSALTGNPLFWAFGPGIGMMIGISLSTVMNRREK